MQTPTRPAHAGYPEQRGKTAPPPSRSARQLPNANGSGEPSLLAVAAQQAAQARSAALALLAELEHAHSLITVLVRQVGPVAARGHATRHHERATVLALARSCMPAQPGVHHG